MPLRHQTLEHEALVRISGTSTKNNSDEAKVMARAATDALAECKTYRNKIEKFKKFKKIKI